jgi:hypothetical protein
LSLPVFVGIGLISYSAYLRHQPLFAFARILSLNPPGMPLMALLSLVTLALAYVTWKYVEQPFRDRDRVSSRAILVFSVAGSAALAASALAVYALAGLPERVPGIGLGHGKHIVYNERVFAYKRDQFAGDKPKLLVVGNSTARDLTNVMLESGKFKGFDIIYRDDLTLCNANPAGQAHGDLIAAADALVWAASFDQDPTCHFVDTAAPPISDKPLVLVGPKHFGYNLNVYIFTPIKDRPAVRAAQLPEVAATNAVYRKLVPARNYEDLLAKMQNRFGGVPAFNASGQILSADRVHLTHAGATFFADFVFDDPVWDPVFAVEHKSMQQRPAAAPAAGNGDGAAEGRVR